MDNLILGWKDFSRFSENTVLKVIPLIPVVNRINTDINIWNSTSVGIAWYTNIIPIKY